MGLSVRPPHINYSTHNFPVKKLAASEERALFMGFDQVKELTDRTIQRIIRFAPFHSVEDFLTRVDPRIQEAENLVCVGALEGLGNIPSVLKRLQNGGWQQNQLSLFEWVDSNEEAWSLQQKVDAQQEILGASLAAHLLELVADQLSNTGAISAVEGSQQASHRTRTAQGDMLFLSFEDLQGTLDAILYPEVYRQANTSISST